MQFRIVALADMPCAIRWLIDHKMLTTDHFGPLCPWSLTHKIIECDLLRLTDKGRLVKAVRFAGRQDNGDSFAAWLPRSCAGEHSIVAAYLEGSALVETASYATVWDWLHAILEDVREEAESH